MAWKISKQPSGIWGYYSEKHLPAFRLMLVSSIVMLFFASTLTYYAVGYLNRISGQDIYEEKTPTHIYFMDRFGMESWYLFMAAMYIVTIIIISKIPLPKRWPLQMLYADIAIVFFGAFAYDFIHDLLVILL